MSTRTKIECTNCNSINYNMSITNNKLFVIKKYCKKCNNYQEHRETV